MYAVVLELSIPRNTLHFVKIGLMEKVSSKLPILDRRRISTTSTTSVKKRVRLVRRRSPSDGWLLRALKTVSIGKLQMW